MAIKLALIRKGSTFMWEAGREVLRHTILFYSGFIFLYSILVFLAYGLLTGAALRRLRQFIGLIRTDMTQFSYYTKPVSILVPAYNEEQVIVASVHSLLKLDYPEYEIIVINDGSKDRTLQELQEAFALEEVKVDYDEQLLTAEVRTVYRSPSYPNLTVVDKANGGKSDALNTGINFSRYPLFCAVDADCVVEPDALFRLINPYLKYDNVIAVGGMVRIANGSEIRDGRVVNQKIPTKWIERFQTVEYLRAFIISRVGFQKLNAVMLISGAFGLFDKTVVIAAGGYRKTIGEDMELVLRMQEFMLDQGKPYKIDFTSDAICWTQAPNRYKDLAGQRRRWHCGLIDSLWKHKRMLFNPKFGRIGYFSMPFYFGIELLGPLFESIGYLFFIIGLLTGTLSWVAAYLLAIAYLGGLLFSLTAILYDQVAYHRYHRLSDVGILLLSAVIEATYYRSITVYWRTKAFFTYSTGKNSWGSIQRAAFSPDSLQEGSGGQE